MRSKKILAGAILLAVASVGFVASASAEELQTHKVPGVIVEAERDARDTYDGRVIRTGGDVTVITQKDIEENHYDNVLAAIKKVPGVEVKTPGYRGIEYGNAYTGATIAINGDNRVIFCIDGKKMTNDSNTHNISERSKGQIAMLMGIVNVERIEVIRGAAAMAYGSDCTGGVINIITKKTTKPSTTIDLSTGSWGKHKGSIAHINRAGKLGVMVTGSRDRGKDTKYKDHVTNTSKTFKCTNYKEDSAFVKLDYDFDKSRALEVSFSYVNNTGGYPIFAPDYAWEGAIKDYLETGNKQDGVTNPNNRWHRWWYYYGDALLGSFSKERAQNIDAKYTFAKEDGIESYARVYRNVTKHYMHRFRGMDDLSGFRKHDIAKNDEDVRGIEIKGGKKLGDNQILYSGFNYQKSQYQRLNSDTDAVTQHIRRDSMSAFLQDKISISDKFTVTPGVRYQWVGNSIKNGALNAESDSRVTFGTFAEYKFDKSSDVYFSWSQVYNTPYASDIENQKARTPDKPLQAEKGNSYTIGINKSFGPKDRINVNYALVDMKNAIGRYSVWDEDYGDYKATSTNIKMKKKSLNIQGVHKFNDNWSLTASYSYAITDKSLTNLSSSYTSYDNLYNSFKYTNKYLASLNYEKGKLNGALDVEHYTGMDERYFSDKKATVLNLHLNYKVNKDLTAYFLMNNITNEAYETRANSTYGIGTFPMEGRSFMVGMNYKF